MKKILVAVDGSENSRKAVGVAIEIAEPSGAEVKVLNVYPQDIYQALRKETGEKRTIEEYVEDARQIAVKITDSLQTKRARFNCVGRVGYPSEEILTLAESENFDLVVVGLTGLHAVGRVRAFGSISRRVVESSKRPVLVVPHQK